MKKLKNKFWYLLNRWWFYPILWFICVFILALISDSESQGDTFKEDLIFFSYALPLGWLLIFQTIVSKIILSSDKGGIIFVVGYYLIYVAGFISLPFIKKTLKKYLIVFLLFWLLSAFVGCSIFAGGLHSGW